VFLFFARYFLPIFLIKNCALLATIMILKLIKTAPMAALKQTWKDTAHPQLKELQPPYSLLPKSNSKVGPGMLQLLVIPITS
jgi:hypothetical protein